MDITPRVEQVLRHCGLVGQKDAIPLSDTAMRRIQRCRLPSRNDDHVNSWIIGARYLVEDLWLERRSFLGSKILVAERPVDGRGHVTQPLVRSDDIELQGGVQSHVRTRRDCS